MDEVRVLLHWNDAPVPLSEGALRLILAHFRAKFRRCGAAYEERIQTRPFEWRGGDKKRRELVVSITLCFRCHPPQSADIRRLIDAFGAVLKASTAYVPNGVTADD